jgi:hypothetical protein
MARRFSLPQITCRGDVLFLALVAAHLLLKLALGVIMVHVRPSGDELAYMDAAKALSNAVRDLLHLMPPDTGELTANVVGNGWFMPGMPLLATPLYLIDPDASLLAMRAYVGVLTFGLWLWSMLAVRRFLGNVHACALLVIPSLIPLWVMFTFTLWGDLCAGLVLVVLLARAYAMVRQYRAGHVPSWRQALALGVLAAAVLYLRASTLPLVPLLFAALLLAAWLFAPRQTRMAATLNLVAAGSVFLALLLPWSIAASAALRAPVLTTTSVPLSLAITFGDTRKLCYGPCPNGEIWLTSVRYSRELEMATGRNAIDVQKAMSRHALAGVTTHAYAAKVVENFDRYLLRPNAFVSRFMPTDDSPTRRIIDGTTRLMYYLAMFAFMAAMLAVFRRSFDLQAESLLIKLFSLSLMLQPFVHISHGRYWPVFAPFFGLSLGLLLQAHAARRSAARTDGSTAFAPSPTMIWTQALFVIGIIAVAAGVLIVAHT